MIYNQDQQARMDDVGRRRQMAKMLMGNMAQQGGESGIYGAMNNALISFLMRGKLKGMDSEEAAINDAARMNPKNALLGQFLGGL